MKEPAQWISEKWKNVEILYRIKTAIHEEKTDFQHLQIVDTFEYGRMLLLDGIVQTTEKDEFVYHEMMVHVPMLSHPDPKDVLIIGGGDGGILREVLKHPSVERATMVEIDPHVIDLCKAYLPAICGHAFDDKRTDLVVADGAEYVEKVEHRFDVVIVDSPDPVGPARILFSEKFYSDVHGIMKPAGIMVRQTGSIHMQVEEQQVAHGLLTREFQHVDFYVYVVPTYVGGFFSSIFCSDRIASLTIALDDIQQRFDKADLATRYYHPGLHVAGFQLPKFMRAFL